MYDKFSMSSSSWTPESETSSKSHSSGIKVLLFLVVLFALATVVMAVVLVITVLRDKDNGDKEQATQPATTPCPTVTSKLEEDVCLTEGCVSAAARVRNAMDTSMWPCEDFYQFACGSWLKKNVIPEHKSSYSTFAKLTDDVSIQMKYLLEEDKKPTESDVIHKVKDYYKGCLNEDKIEELGLDFILSYMEGFGGMPIMGSGKGGSWDETAFNLEDLMIQIRNETNVIPLVDIYVAQDDKNPIKHILTMDQSNLGMPSRDFYLKGRNDTILLAYQTMLIDIYVAFGADKTTAEQDAKDIVDFEIQLANITIRREDRRDSEKMYNKMTVGDLKNHFTNKLDWVKLAKGTLAHANIHIDETEPVIVVATSYFEKLMEIVNKHSNRVLANFLVGNRVLAKTFYLPAKFTDIKLEFQKILTGSSTRSPRWQSCGNNAVSSMQQVAGRLFVDKYFKKEAKDNVLKLVEHLRASMKDIIADNDWMGSSTKSFAEDKADHIEPRIGYPDWIHNETRLARDYKEVTVYRDDPLRTILSFNKNGVQQNLKVLRKDYDKSEWSMSPSEVNAYYSPSTNQITFPASLFQPPFYSEDQPAYLNFGGIGFVIGHEITHGFDDRGRLYDKDGNLKSWWTDTDAAKFKTKAQCMVDQYGSYVLPGTGNMTLNGIITLGENIADNGGLKESFKAYRKWVAANGKEEPKLPGLPYTGNQLFFVNAAQIDCEMSTDEEKKRRIPMKPHSFDRFRVIGPLQNSEDFAAAFQCPSGSKMNPKRKCSVW